MLRCNRDTDGGRLLRKCRLGVDLGARARRHVEGPVLVLSTVNSQAARTCEYSDRAAPSWEPKYTYESEALAIAGQK